jgi:hypothetical protein
MEEVEKQLTYIQRRPLFDCVAYVILEQISDHLPACKPCNVLSDMIAIYPQVQTASRIETQNNSGLNPDPHEQFPQLTSLKTIFATKEDSWVVAVCSHMWAFKRKAVSSRSRRAFVPPLEYSFATSPCITHTSFQPISLFSVSHSKCPLHLKKLLATN